MSEPRQGPPPNAGPPPGHGPVKFEDIENCPPGHAGHWRAAAVGDLGDLTGATVTTKGGVRYTVLSGPRVEGNVVEFDVEVFYRGDVVTPDRFNPIRVVNPPTLVTAANGDIVRSYDDGTTRKFRYDPRAALLEMMSTLWEPGSTLWDEPQETD